MSWYHKEDGWTVNDLCHAANDHLVAAMTLFESRRAQVQDSAGFLIHLGIELLLKAALLQLVGKFPNEHDLSKLRGHLADARLALELREEYDKAFDRISGFHEPRYHNPTGLPSIGHPDGELMRELFAALLEVLPTEVAEAVHRIDHTEKSGRKLYEKRAD